MTSADVQLHLRSPLWARAWVVAFPVLLVPAGVFVVRPGGSGWSLVRGIGVAVFTGLLCWRLYRLATIGRADGRLVVRNHWRDRTLHRDDIARVTAGQELGRGTNRSVRLLLRDGSTVALDVTATSFRAMHSDRLERQAEQVRAWVSGRPQPFL